MTRRLCWQDRDQGRSAWAYSGSFLVGMVGLRDNGRWFYSATNAVYMRRIAKGDGEVTSKAAAIRAVERAWGKWLTAAGLTPIIRDAT